MASQWPPKKNDPNGWTGYVSLKSQANTKKFQANPTLAAGDAKIAIDDGAPNNLNTLPAVDADFTKRVKVVLNQAETNGDNLTIILSDAAGDEWCDLTINLQTVPDRQAGDSYTRLGAPAGASIAADIAAVPTVSEIQTEMEENGASLLDTIRDLLENGTYGLNALDTDLGTLLSRIPAEVAQKSHLVNGTGDIAPPTDTGLWDVLEDLIDGGRLDLLIDAIKAITDQFSFTGGNAHVHLKALDDAIITAAKIAANAITDAKIAANAIAAAKIATGAITADKIAANAIAANKIASGAITNVKFAANAINSTVLADNAITAAKIANAAIIAAKFGAGAIDAAALAADAVDEIVADILATPANKLTTDATGRVTVGSNADKTGYGLADGAITAVKIAANAIANAKIADGAISVGKLADNAITAAKLAANAITSAKLADGAITAAKFAAAAITATVIATGAVDADALAAGAVTKIHQRVTENSKTFEQMFKLMYAALCNETTNSGLKFRDDADSKDRLSFTIDGSNNRTAVVKDPD